MPFPTTIVGSFPQPDGRGGEDPAPEARRSGLTPLLPFNAVRWLKRWLKRWKKRSQPGSRQPAR